MPKKNIKQPLPKPYQAWLVSNWGIPWSVERTRREAIQYAVKISCKEWKAIRDHFAVHKVLVKPL